MYTILLGDDNQLVVSVEERIMQRSKLVDNLHFLVEPIYKEENMSEYTCLMEYLPPVSKEYKTEILEQSDEQYKGMIEFKLPFDTNLTAEAGDVEVQLTFYKVEMLADGTGVQRVRHTQKCSIKILPISAWSNIIPDAALTALDQRMVEQEALIQQLADASAAIASNKADGLIYNEGRLQLKSGTKAIGNTVQITQSGTDPEDGTIRVVEF